ncbi:Imm63 family immunity protein [Spirosoma radiotolerans]|uniref:Imm63 family immunity protein n=1 Tax=Spirosoma radiotolerans TaxID=1379870 RepID=UPI000698A47C|nr:Imm63 family immunity protein [Spirosoma radiotolerans]
MTDILTKTGIKTMTLSAIKEQVETLGDLINAPHYLYPTYGHSVDGALPHVELDDSGTFHFVVVERGQELERQTTTALDELLFWIFDSITFSMACRFERANRNHNQDFRRTLFRYQEELLGCLNVNWQARKRTDHNLTLVRHPFTDDVFNA